MGNENASATTSAPVNAGAPVAAPSANVGGMSATRTQSALDAIESQPIARGNKNVSNKASVPSESKDVKVEGAPEAPKTFRVKVDGKEIDVTEAEIIRLAQLGKSAYGKFEEAAKERKKVEEFKSALKKDFVGALSKHGKEMGLEAPQIRQMVEDYLVDQIKKESMTPDQKSKYEMEQELKSYKEKEHLTKQQAEAQEMAQLQEQYAAQYDRSFSDALQKTNIPKTPFTVARMATYMSQALEAGYDLDPMDAAKLVHEDYQSDIKVTFKDMTGEQIINLIGADNAKKIRQHDVSKLQNRYVKPKGGETEEVVVNKGKKDHKSWEDFTSRLDRIQSGEVEV